MSAQSITSQLSAATAALEEVQRDLNRIQQDHARLLESGDLRPLFTELQAALQLSQQRLADPCFSIATLGTTSSGKSTLVNGLVGRRIAPIEADEMSAGVLTFKHGARRELVIDPAQAGEWQSGHWRDVEDGVTYDRVKDAMRSFHQQRQRRSLQAPHVLVRGPILPTRDRSLLALPDQVGVEVVDLPGLKSVSDEGNLAVIQERVRKSFNIVVLDYARTDDATRFKLMHELRETVSLFNGQSHLMLFAVNRVDLRGHDDDAVAVRIQKLQREIREQLELSEEPLVLPLNAKMLYYAQAAWGSSALDESPEVLPEQSLPLLAALFRECHAELFPEAGLSQEHEWLEDCEREVRRRRPLAPDHLRRLVAYVREQSGANALWAEIRHRMARSFGALVVGPAVLETLLLADRVTGLAQAIGAIRQEESRAELERQLASVQKTRRGAKKRIEALRVDFTARLTQAGALLKDESADHLAEAETLLGAGFRSLTQAVGSIRRDLSESVVRHVAEALQSDEAAAHLHEKLADATPALPPEDIMRIVEYLPDVRTSFQKMEREKDGTYRRQAHTSDAEARQTLTRLERTVIRFYLVMRGALRSRARLLLQGCEARLRQALTHLVTAHDERLYEACIKLLPAQSEKSPDHLRELLRPMLSAERQELPGDLFEFGEPAKLEGQQVEETQVRVRVIPRQQSCYERKISSEEVVEEQVTVGIETLRLPSPEQMEQQWSGGLKAGEAMLWENLLAWVEVSLQEASEKYGAQVEEVLNLITTELDRAISRTNEDFSRDAAIWGDLDATLAHLAEATARLKQISSAGASDRRPLVPPFIGAFPELKPKAAFAA